MASKIVSKPYTQEYLDTWERIFGKGDLRDKGINDLSPAALRKAANTPWDASRNTVEGDPDLQGRDTGSGGDNVGGN